MVENAHRSSTAVLMRLSRLRTWPASIPAAAWMVAPILVFSAMLRFADVSKRGLVYWDEGKFALEGIRLQSVLGHLCCGGASQVAGKAVGTAKPTHALLIALAYGALGVHDYSPLLLNATASVLEVAVLYALARHFFGSGTALLAALFLGVSQYDVIYARSALSESDANLVFLGGVLVWSYGRRYEPQQRAWLCTDRLIYPAMAGTLMGVAFTINYRLLVYIVAIVGLDLMWGRHQRERRRTIGAVSVWAGTLLLAPILWEVIGLLFQAHGTIIFRNEISRLPTSYFQEVFYQLHGGRQSVFRFSPFIYLEWYIVRQGWLMLILVLLGAGIAAVRRTLPCMMALIAIGLPYLVYMFAPIAVPRNLDAALPFSSLLAAGAVVSMVSQTRPVGLWRVMLLAGVIVIAGLGFSRSWNLVSERSGFALATQYVQQHAGGRTLANNELMVFYLRGNGVHCNAPRLPKSLSRLAAAVGAGFGLVVIEGYSPHMNRHLRAYARVVARYEAVGPLDLEEDPIASENGDPPARNATQRYVYVFRVDRSHLPPARAADAPTCSVDRLV
jgi:hypothetical protein